MNDLPQLPDLAKMTCIECKHLGKSKVVPVGNLPAPKGPLICARKIFDVVDGQMKECGNLCSDERAWTAGPGTCTRQGIFWEKKDS